MVRGADWERERVVDKAVLVQLQMVPLFARLSEADVLALTQGARVMRYADDHLLFQAGEAVQRVFVVLEGHVELTVEVQGRRSVVEVARRGTVLGDVALFGERVAATDGRVADGAVVLEIPAAEFLATLESRFDLMLPMLGNLSARLRRMVRQIAELKLKNTAQRLGLFLLSQTSHDVGRVEIRFPYDKKLVAEELGMKPESLSRALGKLARVGVESLTDNSVAIAHVEKLRDFCAEDV